MGLSKFWSDVWATWIAIQHSRGEITPEPDVVSSLLPLLFERKPTESEQYFDFDEELQRLRIRTAALPILFKGVMYSRKQLGMVAIDDTHRKVFYKTKQFYDQTTHFVESDVYKQWQLAKELPLRALLGKHVPAWVLRRGKVGEIPDGAIPYPGALFNAYGADNAILVGFRDVRDLPVAADGSPDLRNFTTEDRLRVLNRAPRRGDVHALTLASSAWMERDITRFNLADHLAATSVDFPELCRGVLSLLLTVNSAEQLVTCGDIDFTDAALGNKPAGRTLVVRTPFANHDELPAALQAALTDATAALLGDQHLANIIVCTNHDERVAIDALKSIAVPERLSADIYVFGINAIAASLGSGPWLWSDWHFGPPAIDIAHTDWHEHIRRILRDDEFPLLHYGLQHPSVSAARISPGDNVRITGSDGAGKSVAMIQLVLRDLAPTVVFALRQEVTSRDVALAEEIATDLLARAVVPHVTFAIDNIHNLTEPEAAANDLMLCVGRLRQRFGRSSATVLISYTPFRRRTIEDAFPSWFAKHHFRSPISLGSDVAFLGKLAARYREVWRVDIDGHAHRLHEFATFVHNWNGSARTLLRLLKPFANQEFMLERVPIEHVMRETNQAWYDQFVDLNRRHAAVAPVLEIVAYFRFLQLSPVTQAIVAHYFETVFKASPLDFAGAMRVLHDAGWVSFGDSNVDIAEVNVKPELTGLLSQLTTRQRIREYDIFTLNGAENLGHAEWQPALASLTRSLIDRDEPELAMHGVARISHFFPRDVSGWRLRGLALAITGQYESAFNVVTAYANAALDDATIWNELAHLYSRRGEHDWAKRAKEAGLSNLVAKDQMSKVRRWDVRMHHDDIVRTLRQQLEQQPGDFAAVMMLIAQHLVRGDFETAHAVAAALPEDWDEYVRPELRLLAQSNGANPFTYCVLATEAFVMKRFDADEREDMTFHERVAAYIAAHAPDAADLLLGEHYYRRREYRQARSHFTAVLHRVDALRQSFTWIQQRLMVLVDTDHERIALTAHVNSDADIPADARIVRAIAYLNLGMLELAERDLVHLEEELRNSTACVRTSAYDQARVMLAAAVGLQQATRVDEAIQWLDRCEDQSNPAVVALRGMFYALKEDSEKALPLLIASTRAWGLPDQLLAGVANILCAMGRIEGLNTLWAIKVRGGAALIDRELVTADELLAQHPSVKLLLE